MSISINKSNLSIQLNNILTQIQQELSTLKAIKANKLVKEYDILINDIYLSRKESYDRLCGFNEGNADVVSPPTEMNNSISDLTKSRTGLISALREKNPSKILSNIYRSEANLRKALVELDNNISIRAIKQKVKQEIDIKDQNLSQLERALRTNSIENLNLQ